MEKVNEYFYIKKEEKNYCRCRAVFEGNAEYKNAYEFSKKLIEYFYITCQRMCDYDAEGEAELRSRFNVLPYSYEANIKAEDAGEGFCSLSVKYSLCARFPGGKSFCESECILFDEKRNLIISPAALCRILLGKNAKKTNDPKILRKEGKLFLVYGDIRSEINTEELESRCKSIMRKKKGKALDNKKKM